MKISINLAMETVKKIDFLAAKKKMNRQDYLSKLLTEKFAEVKLIQEECLEASIEYCQANLRKIYKGDFWEHLQTNIDRLKKGDETSLKKLAGKELWKKMGTATFRRTLGKVFKRLQGLRITGLIIGRVKSNNEQQYVKK